MQLLLLLKLASFGLLLLELERSGLLKGVALLLGRQLGSLAGLVARLLTHQFCGFPSVGLLLHLGILGLLPLLVLGLDGTSLHVAAHDVLLFNLKAFRQKDVQNTGLVDICIDVGERGVRLIGSRQVTGTRGR